MEDGNEKLINRYHSLFDEMTSYEQVHSCLLQMDSDPDIDDLRGIFICEMLHPFSYGVSYPAKPPKHHLAVKRLITKNIQLSSDEDDYMQAIACFFRQDYEDCMVHIQKMLKNSEADLKEQPLNEQDFTVLFLHVFKNAWSGFWAELAKLLEDCTCESGIVSLCQIMEQYYSCQTDLERTDLLLRFSPAHPNLSVPKVLLAWSYIQEKKWHNAISCLEQVKEQHYYFGDEDFFYNLAFCYGAVRNNTLEEKYYRKSLECDPEGDLALNNLGYCLYKMKRYDEALSVFLRCLNEERDTPQSANNYIRTLLALGQYKTAQTFLSETNYRIAKRLRLQVASHEPCNTDTEPGISDSIDTPDESDEQNGDGAVMMRIHNTQQFYSEKTLEDELTARIEAGYEVFGRKLKIFNRIGDFYGRQYPIANGRWRLDLLCEDESGNLVVIELKRDHGYDDPYDQIIQYIEWLKQNMCKSGKTVIGIICLNSPTKNLISKVRSDKRVQLYEYQVSYHEVF